MTNTNTDPAVTPAERLEGAGELVASRDANAELEHTRGGTTTRSDLTDVGVPMIPGAANEPVGPEDALGVGPKRGDYSGRMALEGMHTATEVIPEDERVKMAEDRYAELKKDNKKLDEQGVTIATILGDIPRTRVVNQSARAGDVGDAPGKGGVSTEAARAAAGDPTVAAA